MKTTPFLEYILYDVFGEHEPVSARAMMGGYMLYHEGKPFALVEDDEIYLKGSQEIAPWYLKRGSKQFTYTKQGKDAHLHYYRVPSEVYEDRSIFETWVDMALSVAQTPESKK